MGKTQGKSRILWDVSWIPHSTSFQSYPWHIFDDYLFDTLVDGWIPTHLLLNSRSTRPSPCRSLVQNPGAVVQRLLWVQTPWILLWRKLKWDILTISHVTYVSDSRGTYRSWMDLMWSHMVEPENMGLDKPNKKWGGLSQLEHTGRRVEPAQKGWHRPTNLNLNQQKSLQSWVSRGK